jgi:hypothetical protein
VFIAELLQATQSPLATSENVSAEDLVNDLPGRSFSALAYNKVQPNGNIKTDVKGFQTLTKAAENGNPSFGYAMQGEVSESPISSTANSSTGTSTGRPLFR